MFIDFSTVSNCVIVVYIYRIVGYAMIGVVRTFF